MRHVPLLALAAILSTPAMAGRLADVSIIDRDTGRVLSAHLHKGEYWVAGRPGAHYAIRISNRDGRRLEAVASVDGVNVITGDTAGVDQRGYVFSAWQSWDITGWRKSSSEIAAFTFTSVPASYAARTGRPENVGVIGVALFRERVPVRHQPEPMYEAAPREAAPPAPPAPQSAPQSAPPVMGPPAGAAGRGGGAKRSESRAANQAGDSARYREEQSLGTGHGRREVSVVTTVDFIRERSQPDEVIRIRYDSHQNLVAMGVIPRPAPPARRPDPFPESGYVPDP